MAERAVVLATAYAAHPERFPGGVPQLAARPSPSGSTHPRPKRPRKRSYSKLANRCLTFLLTGSAACVADANLGRAPLVAITGQAGREQIHKELLPTQYLHIVDLFRPSRSGMCGSSRAN